MAADPFSPTGVNGAVEEDEGRGRVRAVASLGLLFSALALFAAFHFLPGFQETGGWKVWPEIWIQAQNLRFLDAQGAMVYAAFLSFSFLIVVCPFLGRVWRKSRWALWGTLVFSGLAGGAFWVMYFSGLTSADLGSPTAAGEWCLLAAPLANFLGLVLAGPVGKRPRVTRG